MKLTACLVEQVGRLIHPTAHASPAVAARHRSFIETRLAVGFAALAILPCDLAAGHVPNGFEATVLGCLVLPFVAVAVLSARGRLAEAELISAAGWIGLVVALMAGRLAGPIAATLLVLVPLEASFDDDATKLRLAAALACAGTVLAIVAVPDGPTSTFARGILLIGVLHGTLLCLRAAACRREVVRHVDAMLQTDRQLADAITDVVIRFDGVSATVVNARAAQARLGVAADDLADRGFFDRIHVADRPMFLQVIGDADLAEGRSLEIRLRTSGQDAGAAFRKVELRVRRSGVEDASDARARFTTVAQVRPCLDEPVSPVVAAPPAPVASVDESWRDRLLANFSHELRTPLNAIIGFSEILASDKHRPQRTETSQEYAGIINASGQHLLGIVNSMLDLSKIDAGKFELTPEPFDVGDLIDSCRDMVRLKAEQARIDLVARVEPARLQITADKRACRQILLNLLSNALKFTPEYGRATIEARLDGDWVMLEVADTGIGMLPQDLARLGDRFFQAQTATDRRFEGTGLGLSLVSGLVGLHGGAIMAESAPGEGTRIVIRLPRDLSGIVPNGQKVRIETVSLPSRSSVAAEVLHPKVKKIA